MIWAYLGAVYLVWLTVQDLKNNMLVDDRKNYFMLGMSISLVEIFGRVWYYVILVIVITFFLYWLSPRLKKIGVADIHTLTWIVFGFALIDAVYLLLTFWIALLVLTVPYLLIWKWIKPHRQKAPYYPVLLVAFVFVAVAFGLFGYSPLG